MEQMKTDRRVKYTKRILRESLLAIMNEKNITRITVKEICERADVNRGTFYAHYKDPSDLLKQIEDELLGEIRDTLARHAARRDQPRGTYEVILEIVRSIRENSDLCRILLGGHGHPVFIETVVLTAREEFLAGWTPIPQTDADALGEYPYMFVVMGSIGVLRRWIESGMREPPEQIASVVDRLAYQGLSTYIR